MFGSFSGCGCARAWATRGRGLRLLNVHVGTLAGGCCWFTCWWWSAAALICYFRAAPCASGDPKPAPTSPCHAPHTPCWLATWNKPHNTSVAWHITGGGAVAQAVLLWLPGGPHCGWVRVTHPSWVTPFMNMTDVTPSQRYWQLDCLWRAHDTLQLPRSSLACARAYCASGATL